MPSAAAYSVATPLYVTPGLISPANEAEAEDEPCEESLLDPVDPLDPVDAVCAAAEALGFALVADACGVLEAVAVGVGVAEPIVTATAAAAVVLALELVLTAAYPVATSRCGVEPMATLAITAMAANVAAPTDPMSHFRCRPPPVSGPRWVVLTLQIGRAHV